MISKQQARDIANMQRTHELSQKRVVNVLLVERCTLFRKAIHKSIEASGQVDRVTEVESVTSAALALKSRLPDIVLLGTSVSTEECLSVTRLVKKHHTHIGMIALRVKLVPQIVQMLIKSGIHVILDETVTEQDLTFAIKASAVGQAFHSRRVYEQMMAPSGKGDMLTNSEMQTLSLLMHGAKNHIIAKKLCITVKTVEAHLTRIYRKLGVNSRAQAILRAQELHFHFNSDS
jgi:DNA-binding NarL/FixJ family response regulator